MKNILSIIVGIAVIFTVVIFLTRDERITNYPSKNSTIVAFGDSLIAGVGASAGNDLVTLLSSEIGRPIVNFGKSGDTTSSAKERIGLVLDQKPKVTIILLGGNDFLRKVPQEETFRNLKEMIVRIQETGSIVVVLGVRSGLIGGSTNEKYEDLAKETGSLYVEDVLKGLIARQEYMHDAIHPNDAGYRKIAERVLPVLQKALE